MADIVISEFNDDAAVSDLARDYEVLYDPALVDRPADLAAALSDARALIVRNRTQVTAELLAAAPRLAVVGRLGVGLDNIDLAACESRGVAVCPATGANAVAVAEYVIATILVLVRGAYMATARVVAGEWPRGTLIGRKAAGRQLGLVGFGGVAREVARRARALDMTVAAYDPFLAAVDPVWDGVTRLDLPAPWPAADVISPHVPLTEATRHLVDADALAAMRPGAVLINTARGGVVDEAAVVAALKAGRLGGAALDVFEAEPLDGAGGTHFADVPGLVLTPHIAGRAGRVRRSEVRDETAQNPKILSVLCTPTRPLKTRQQRSHPGLKPEWILCLSLSALKYRKKVCLPEGRNPE